MSAAVTVFLFVCNRTGFLAESLASVLAQSREDWRLFVSDASDDPAARVSIEEIVAGARSRAPHVAERVQLIRPPRRLRQVAHMRWALALATTTWVAVLDDDDVWLPDHLGRALAWLEADPHHGLAVSNSIRIRADGTRMSPTNPVDRELFPPEAPRRWLDFLVRSPFSSTSGYVFRRDALVRPLWHEGSAVDSLLAVSVLAAGFRYRGLAEPGFLYRVHDGSFYTGGARDFVRARHAWRWWALWRHGWALTRALPVFPLLALKSGFHLARAAFQPAPPAR